MVTIADHEAEAILSEGLAKLEPAAKVVGEEACAADPSVFERVYGNLVEETGAVIMGRRSYNNSIEAWGGKGPFGDVPCFVVTHRPPASADPVFTPTCERRSDLAGSTGCVVAVGRRATDERAAGSRAPARGEGPANKLRARRW